MKKFILLMVTLFSLQANAGLLTFNNSKTDYLMNENVLVDVIVNNINTDAAELSFDINFDETLLTLNSFVFSDNVLNSAFITDADTYKATDILTVLSIWFSPADVPAASFTLGQVSFTALADFNSTFTENNLYVADDNLNSIAPQSTQTSVPEPQTLLLFTAAFALLLMRRKV